jgi:hypothetical protein
VEWIQVAQGRVKYLVSVGMETDARLARQKRDVCLLGYDTVYFYKYL